MRNAMKPSLAMIPIGTVAIFLLFVAGHAPIRPQSSWRKEVGQLLGRLACGRAHSVIETIYG